MVLITINFNLKYKFKKYYKFIDIMLKLKSVELILIFETNNEFIINNLFIIKYIIKYIYNKINLYIIYNNI